MSADASTPYSLGVAVLMSLAFTVAFRFSVYLSVSSLLRITFAMRPSIKCMRLARWGEAFAVLTFASLALGLSDIVRQYAAGVFFVALLGYLAAIIDSVLRSTVR